MDDKKPDNVDEFEEEIAEEQFKEPLPHFDDEIEYLSENSGEQKGFMSRMFKLPRFSVGWLGILLIILIPIFLYSVFFTPKGSKKIDNEELIILKSRVEDLESQENNSDIVDRKLEKIETDILKGIQISDRLDQLEKLLISKIDTLEKDVENIKVQVEAVKQLSAVQIKKTQSPQTTQPKEKKSVQTQSPTYHTVQRGENVYRIALKYSLSESELLKFNNLSKGALIYPGQKLKVGN